MGLMEAHVNERPASTIVHQISAKIDKLHLQLFVIVVAGAAPSSWLPLLVNGRERERTRSSF